VVLLTNMWGEVSHEVGEARERELTSNFFKPALDKGAQLVRHHNTEQSAHTLGAEGVLPGRHIVSLLRVFKQFTHLIPSG
jgi:hypothetical protein